MSEELKLAEYGGQCCDAVIVKRDDQSVFVRFSCDRGYGGPNMEIDKVRELLGRMEVVAGVSSTVRRDSITVDLLAAMPVLLAACKSAVDYFNCSQSRQRWLDDNKMSPLVHLKLAIAKAEESK